MVQSIESLINKPVYNAVNINIRKPEINTKESNTVINDNGIYNAVKINIDKPAINPIHNKPIYCYPNAQECVTYDMAGLQPFALPEGFPITAEYHSASIILPEEEKPEVPAPNYTTVEAENNKKIVTIAPETLKDEKEDNAPNGVTFHGTEPTVKKPEIVPPEDIKPDVDIPLVVSNLNNSDFDVQAQQMEEIVRTALDDKKKAIPYLVRDVYSELINITTKDTSNLAAPSPAQIEARKKIITNILTVEQNPNVKSFPFKLSEEEIALANEISPMEQAERNKEYALYTMATLSKIFIEEVEQETGNVVPFTDIPGISSMIDALRYNPNAGVKAAAIESISYIQRPEYKDELTTLYTLAQTDKNPIVSKSAQQALQKLNQQ